MLTGRRRSVRHIIIVALLAFLCVPSAVEARPSVNKMFAVYKVHFLGASLGKFKLWADIGKGSYTLKGETKLEMGFIVKGLLFDLKGGAQSSGAMKNSTPLPKHYGLHFESKKKRGKLDMNFAGNRVDAVVTQPRMRDNPRAVPVTNAHVTDVLDPLSAVFLTRLHNSGKSHDDACRQTVPVFDGRHRFNLNLTHKKTVRVKRSGKKGYAGVAVVCRIRYAPVSGHAPNNKGLKFFEKTNDIEIWLIPVPGTRAYVPYHVSLPTPYGRAAAISTVFQVQTVGGQNHSLVKFK